MHGTIVLNNQAGRGLRKQRAAVTVADILWCIGRFGAGDPICISFCARDGGQYVVANGVSLLSDAELRERLPALSAKGGSAEPARDDTVVVAAGDIAMRW